MFLKKCVFVSFLGILFLGVGHVGTASAQDYGVRIGASVDPDQFYFGGHFESEPFYEELRFRPNIEIGFGDSVTVVGLNGEFVWPFELNSGSVYAGMGPAVNLVRVDFGATSDTEARAGLNFLIGYEFDEGYFAELKVGAIDSPEVKIGFGYTWR